jgi:hypothetical protein
MHSRAVPLLSSSDAARLSFLSRSYPDSSSVLSCRHPLEARVPSPAHRRSVNGALGRARSTARGLPLEAARCGLRAEATRAAPRREPLSSNRPGMDAVRSSCNRTAPSSRCIPSRSRWPRSQRSSSQPQVCVVVLQVGPAGLPAQSAFVRHPTQSPVVVLHTAGGPSLAQSALVVHLGWHWPAHTSLA